MMQALELLWLAKMHVAGLNGEEINPVALTIIANYADLNASVSNLN